MTEQRYRVSDMDIDEISFVQRGANRSSHDDTGAHIVLHKSDDKPPDPRDVTEGFAIATRAAGQAEVMRRHLGNLALAEHAETRLSELRRADPKTTFEQAVTVVLGEDPGLYQP